MSTSDLAREESFRTSLRNQKRRLSATERKPSVPDIGVNKTTLGNIFKRDSLTPPKRNITPLRWIDLLLFWFNFDFAKETWRHTRWPRKPCHQQTIHSWHSSRILWHWWVVSPFNSCRISFPKPLWAYAKISLSISLSPSHQLPRTPLLPPSQPPHPQSCTEKGEKLQQRAEKG